MLLLAAGLVSFTPSGSAICWPLLDGRHLHIGWSMHAGHPTDTLTVYIHAARAPLDTAALTVFSAEHTPGAVTAPNQLAPLYTWRCPAERPAAGLWHRLGDHACLARTYAEPPEPPPPRAG
ncbi:MAG: hypothetical protein KA764_01500 [Anaerolineales bacterium]|nr:hypothetical protein [Anaerolineales bacterium]